MNPQEANNMLAQKLLEIAAYEKHCDDFRSFQAEADESEFAFSAGLNKRIKKIFKKNQRKAFGGRIQPVIRTVAAAIALILSVSFFGIMTNAAVRESVYEMIAELKDKFVSIFYSTDSDDAVNNDIDAYGIYEPSYLPPDYTLVKEDNFGSAYLFTYSTEDGRRLRIEESMIGLSVFNVDVENYIETSIEIEGFQASVFTSESSGVLYALWSNDTHSFQISGEVTADEVIRIIQGLRIQK